MKAHNKQSIAHNVIALRRTTTRTASGSSSTPSRARSRRPMGLEIAPSLQALQAAGRVYPAGGEPVHVVQESELDLFPAPDSSGFRTSFRRAEVSEFQLVQRLLMSILQSLGWWR